jgi:anti-sigma B factor antagonist
MQLTERRIGHITILDLAGKLILGERPDRVKEKIRELVGRGEKRILLNLADVTLVDSSGLGELVACNTTAWRGGATVKIANAGGRIQDLLVLTKLLTIFDAYESEKAALESYGTSPGSPAATESRR